MTMQENKKFGIAINKWRILMMVVFAILAFTGFLCSIMSGAVAIPFNELENMVLYNAMGSHQQILMNIRLPRSEERRVGKECRSRWSPYH